mmetsp:Transcript_18426/g.53815  ORF Transcript_18426/g.53815 Transcript_18426/m.53815 type:complete len:200 (+) Transcript_18426:196-795(+)
MELPVHMLAWSSQKLTCLSGLLPRSHPKRLAWLPSRLLLKSGTMRMMEPFLTSPRGFCLGMCVAGSKLGLSALNSSEGWMLIALKFFCFSASSVVLTALRSQTSMSVFVASSSHVTSSFTLAQVNTQREAGREAPDMGQKALWLLRETLRRAAMPAPSVHMLMRIPKRMLHTLTRHLFGSMSMRWRTWPRCFISLNPPQ